MYGWIWRHLPGSIVVKAIQAILLVFAMIALLMLVVFPWIEPIMPFTMVTMN
jgi:hypothetical protein